MSNEVKERFPSSIDGTELTVYEGIAYKENGLDVIARELVESGWIDPVEHYKDYPHIPDRDKTSAIIQFIKYKLRTDGNWCNEVFNSITNNKFWNTASEDRHKHTVDFWKEKQEFMNTFYHYE